MKIWSATICKLLWGIYLLLSSLYCLLSFLPYTYYALIKAPAYDWMPWFVHHHARLYWAALLAAAVAYWPGKKSKSYFALFGMQVALGIYISARPFMPALQSNSAAYIWGVTCLLPIVLVAAMELPRFSEALKGKDASSSLLPYSAAVFVAIAVALLYAAGAHVRSYVESGSWGFHISDFELTAWSMISHVLVAVIVLSILNLVTIASFKMVRPRTFRLALILFLTFVALWIALSRFLENALSFEGWPAHLYAGTLAVALTLLGFSIVLPILAGRQKLSTGFFSSRRVLAFGIAAMAVTAVAFPTVIAGGDWNGILQGTFTLALWCAMSICVYCVRPQRVRYSIAAILAIVLLIGSAYKGLQISAILWATPLGATDDDIAWTMEKYAAQDVSFQLAHHFLGNARAEPCGDLCRILQQYTNIRDAEAKMDLKLVDELVPIQGKRPNIFIFVIDSMRPDYLGAYNPRVDFTPSLDSFARENVVLRNVYTQYAGTTLSEPAIWSGAMLLHAHYLQPFSKVNSLEKMANADGYQMMVSYDTVLSQLLSQSDDLVKVDTDKLWNHFEVCSTVEQTQNALDARSDKSQPVLFYAQPMNVHQFANNNRPRMTSENWRTRPQFNNRIAYEVHDVDDCMGRFFRYLKSRGMYDDSIIVVTSDHGDATGQFGRYSHSISIYPEVMRVPLIVHLPKDMRGKFVYDDARISALTDITPSLYYLLGHRPIRMHPLFGRPLFAETKEELERYVRNELFLASDVRAAYGILAENGRFLYATYDSPAQSLLFDLAQDPNAEHNILNAEFKKRYDERIIEHLQSIAEFYEYKPDVRSMLAQGRR